MMRKLLPLALVLAGCSAGEPQAPADVATYDIDPGRITVSGISSGAYMAGQLHVAYSGLIEGAALLAGGPYFCAEGSVTRGIGPCMQGGDLDAGALAGRARAFAESGDIDPVAHLAGDPVWIFIGTLDEQVSHEVAEAAAAFYRELDAEVTLVDDVEVVHGMPTEDSGNACDSFASPFLQNCDYDAAGELLARLDGTAAGRSEPAGELVGIPQPGGPDAGMLDEALLYVPAACAAGASCGVHIAFHGCSQSSAFVGEAFAADAGYNQWADSRRLLVLYPQVDSSKIAPMNPYGCWDWWGYTGDEYATKRGAQPKVVKATLDLLAGKTL
jgi:poly(3-hydroxybutyrate) depolymerase